MIVIRTPSSSAFDTAERMQKYVDQHLLGSMVSDDVLATEIFEAEGWFYYAFYRRPSVEIPLEGFLLSFKHGTLPVKIEDYEQWADLKSGGAVFNYSTGSYSEAKLVTHRSSIPETIEDPLYPAALQERLKSLPKVTITLPEINPVKTTK